MIFDAKRLNLITKEYESKKIAEEEKRRDEIIESITPFLIEIYDEMFKVAKNGEYNYEFILPQEYTKYRSEIEYFFKKYGFTVDVDIDTNLEYFAGLSHRIIEIIRININWE